MRKLSLLSVALLAFASPLAHAGNRVPEPGTLELVALGGVVGLVLAIRKWWKR